MGLNKKAMSSIIVYMILGLILILLMIPIVKYIKDSSDSKMMQQYGVNPNDDFVPYDSSQHLNPEEKTVKNSIDALNCAVNSVADTSNKNYDNACNQESIDTNFTCPDGEYQFGRTCVSCDMPQTYIEGKPNEVSDLIIKCSQDFKKGLLKQKFDVTKRILVSNINTYMCGVLDTSELQNEVTKSRIDGELSSKGVASNGIFSLNFKMEDISDNKLIKSNDPYCLLYNNGITDDITLLPCKSIGYIPSQYSCNIKAFELPQGDQNSGQWYDTWLNDQKAPRYLLYYEAFTQAEEINWGSDYGRVTSGAYVQAAAFGAVFSVLSAGAEGINALRPTNIVKTFSEGGQAITKTIKSIPRQFFKDAETELAKEEMEKLTEEIVEYGVIPSARNQFLKDELNSQEYQVIKGKLSQQDIDSLSSAALSQDSDVLKNNLDLLGASGSFTDGEQQMLLDLAEESSMMSEKGIARSVSFRKFIMSYKDADSLKKALKKTVDSLDSISPETKKLLITDINKNALFGNTKIVNDMLQKTQAADIIPAQTEAIFDDFSTNLFSNQIYKDGGVADAMTNPDTRSFLQSLWDNAASKVPQGLSDANKKYLINKYVTGEIIYLMEMSQTGIVDRYESQGVNTINLGQPYYYGPKPVQKINSNLLDDYILLLSRRNSITEEGTPRFYLASPCKTDLKIEATYCSCEVEKGAPVYVTPDGINFKIENLALTDPNHNIEENRRFWYDSLSLPNQEKAIKSCVESSDCARVSLNQGGAQFAYIKLFTEGLFLNSVDWVGSLNQDTCYDSAYDGIQSDTPLYDFWTKKYSSLQTSASGGVLSNFKIPPYIEAFQSLFVNLFPTKDSAKNSGLYQIMEQMSVTTINGKKCMIKSQKEVPNPESSREVMYYYLSDILLSKYTNINGNSMTPEQAQQATSAYVDFLSTTAKSVYDSTANTNDYQKLKPYFDSITKYYYFNYYLLPQGVVDTNKIAKACNNMIVTTKDASDELSDLQNKYYDPSKTSISMRSQCMMIEPSGYSQYTKNGYPYNYCFTGDTTDSWKVAKGINTVAWAPVDIGLTAIASSVSGGLAGPITYATMAAATSVGQTWVDGWIMSNQKWPQPKTDEKQ